MCIDLKPQVTPTATLTLTLTLTLNLTPNLTPTLTLTLQNLVLFGSILDVKLIDLECIRKVP